MNIVYNCYSLVYKRKLTIAISNLRIKLFTQSTDGNEDETCSKKTKMQEPDVKV